MRGLLGNADPKNGLQLAEEMGGPTPDGVQHLLARACWDADAVRDELLRYVAESLGHREEVLIIDEIGFLKKRPNRPATTGNIQGRPAGLRTRGLVCFCITPASGAGLC